MLVLLSVALSGLPICSYDKDDRMAAVGTASKR